MEWNATCACGDEIINSAARLSESSLDVIVCKHYRRTQLLFLLNKINPFVTLCWENSPPRHGINAKFRLCIIATTRAVEFQSEYLQWHTFITDVDQCNNGTLLLGATIRYNSQRRLTHYSMHPSEMCPFVLLQCSSLRHLHI